MKIGERIGAMLCIDKDKQLIRMIGFGVYAGKMVPPKGRPGPCFKLAESKTETDFLVIEGPNGSTFGVYGCECSWSEEAKMSTGAASMERIGYKIELVTEAQVLAHVADESNVLEGFMDHIKKHHTTRTLKILVSEVSIGGAAIDKIGFMVECSCNNMSADEVDKAVAKFKANPQGKPPVLELLRDWFNTGGAIENKVAEILQAEIVTNFKPCANNPNDAEALGKQMTAEGLHPVCMECGESYTPNTEHKCKP